MMEMHISRNELVVTIKRQKCFSSLDSQSVEHSPRPLYYMVGVESTKTSYTECIPTPRDFRRYQCRFPIIQISPLEVTYLSIKFQFFFFIRLKRLLWKWLFSIFFYTTMLQCCNKINLITNSINIHVEMRSVFVRVRYARADITVFIILHCIYILLYLGLAEKSFVVFTED